MKKKREWQSSHPQPASRILSQVLFVHSLIYSLDKNKAAAVEDDYLNPSKAPSEEVKAALYIPKEVRSRRILN
jgi:hypothetical protein